MAVISQTAGDGKTVTIRVNGRFDFSVHREFRDAYRQSDNPGLLFQVDLSNTEYLDSSALGMLLLLKKHAESCNSRVVIHRPASAIRKLLETANFDRQFAID